MKLHIHWSAPLQPATRYKIDEPDGDGYRPLWFEASGHRLAWCAKCGRWRRLANMMVLAEAWYDPTWYCRECPPKPRRRRKAR